MPHLPVLFAAALVASFAAPSDLGELTSPGAHLPFPFPPPAQPTDLTATFFSGQTFVVWKEAALRGERYRVYRHDEPVTAANLSAATLLYEVWEQSSRYWSDYWRDGNGVWTPRFSATMPLPSGVANEGVPAGTDDGMLVWTLRAEDFAGASTDYYYAVTTVLANGFENRVGFTAENAIGPVHEEVLEPQPLEIAHSESLDGLVRHVYVQYMDLHDWNPTLTAPNRVRTDYGANLDAPGIANAIQYAFSYVVLEPPAARETVLPVVLRLHPFTVESSFSALGFTEVATGVNTEGYYDFEAVEIRPIDSGSTWWFGFAEQGFDYREYADRCEAVDALAAAQPPTVIVNYTEQRVLRMVHDLLRDEHDLAGRVDPERVYVRGYSMGGTGALAMAQRYPNVFAAAHATLPATDFRRLVDPDEPCGDPCFLGVQQDLAFDVALKWGPPGLGPDPFVHVQPGVCSFANPLGSEQPIRLDGPAGLADHLKVHDGTSVYDWQDLVAGFSTLPAGDVVPLSVRHSTIDHIVNWPYQGRPLYEAMNGAGIVWGGLVENFLDHFPWWFLAMPPNYVSLPVGGSFFGFSAVLSETIPGLVLHHTNSSLWTLPPLDAAVSAFNVETPGFGNSVEWSSSWNSWDGLPLDTPDEWGVSLRVVSGGEQQVDVVPRRLQAFEVDVGETYAWSTTTLLDEPLACGCVVVGPDGRLVIEGLEVTQSGVRLHVVRGVDPTCLACSPPPPAELTAARH